MRMTHIRYQFWSAFKAAYEKSRAHKGDTTNLLPLFMTCSSSALLIALRRLTTSRGMSIEKKKKCWGTILSRQFFFSRLTLQKMLLPETVAVIARIIRTWLRLWHSTQYLWLPSYFDVAKSTMSWSWKTSATNCSVRPSIPVYNCPEECVDRQICAKWHDTPRHFGFRKKKLR